MLAFPSPRIRCGTASNARQRPNRLPRLRECSQTKLPFFPFLRLSRTTPTGQRHDFVPPTDDDVSVNEKKEAKQTVTLGKSLELRFSLSSFLCSSLSSFSFLPSFPPCYLSPPPPTPMPRRSPFDLILNLRLNRLIDVVCCCPCDCVQCSDITIGEI